MCVVNKEAVLFAICWASKEFWQVLGWVGTVQFDCEFSTCQVRTSGGHLWFTASHSCHMSSTFKYWFVFWSLLAKCIFCDTSMMNLSTVLCFCSTHKHTSSQSWAEREFLVFWFLFSCAITAVSLCFGTWCIVLPRSLLKVSAHLDTSEATKVASFLLLLYQQLWSEMLRHMSFQNLLLRCLDMTYTEFLLLVPFEKLSVFLHFTVRTLELLIYCLHWFKDAQDVYMFHMIHTLNTDYYHEQH